MSDVADYYIRGVYNYRDRRPTKLNNTAPDFPSYCLLNIYAGIKSKYEAWDVALWMENVTDEEALISFSGESFNSTTGYDFVNFFQEQRVGLSVNYRF